MMTIEPLRSMTIPILLQRALIYRALGDYAAAQEDLVKAVRLGYVSRICRAILNHPKFILMRCNPVRQRRDTVFYISPLAAYFLQINENSITQNPQLGNQANASQLRDDY